MMQKKINGISLLELLLSLALIAILLVAATRFYESTRASEQTTEAVNILQHLTAASDKWFVLYKSYQKTDNGDISLQKLIELGWLPKNFVLADVNPWGGSINVAPQDSTDVTLTLSAIPDKDCTNLKELMQQQLNLVGNCSGGNYTATYSSAGSVAPSK